MMTDQPSQEMRPHHGGVGPPQRWLVLGAGGAGKTTVALRLGELLRLPIIHLDAHFWLPGWIESPPERWRRTTADLAAGGAWIMDGNYSGTLDLRLPRAEAVVLLDLPAAACLWGIITRPVLCSDADRPDLPSGCNEQLPSLDFIKYVATYRRRTRPKVLAMIKRAPHAQFFHLRNRREVRGFLNQW